VAGTLDCPGFPPDLQISRLKTAVFYIGVIKMNFFGSQNVTSNNTFRFIGVNKLNFVSKPKKVTCNTAERTASANISLQGEAIHSRVT
jgi:hypothetical protein